MRHHDIGPKLNIYELNPVQEEAIPAIDRRFTFALPSPQHVLGLPIGQHLSLKRSASGV